jgi:hypothetical protein
MNLLFLPFLLCLFRFLARLGFLGLGGLFLRHPLAPLLVQLRVLLLDLFLSEISIATTTGAEVGMHVSIESQLKHKMNKDKKTHVSSTLI